MAWALVLLLTWIVLSVATGAVIAAVGAPARPRLRGALRPGAARAAAPGLALSSTLPRYVRRCPRAAGRADVIARGSCCAR